MSDTQNPCLLQVEDLKKEFPISSGFLKSKILRAVDGVSFHIDQGETLGLVGESGCGKTTVGRVLLHLYPPTGGKVTFDGKEIGTRESVWEMRKKASIVFQDPYSSLNPRMTVEDIIAEPLDIQGLTHTKQERATRVRELLDAVELPHEHAGRYIHEFSGGQRQRIGIARALAVNPKFIVCDEPVSALDVSIQAQIINMFEDLQDEFGLTYLFIAHDLSVIRHISDRVMVMYLGKAVEIAKSGELYNNPLHPYTRSLLSAVPIVDPRKERARSRIVLEGDVPSPIDLPSGCHFRARCRYATEHCAEEPPPLHEVLPHASSGIGNEPSAPPIDNTSHSADITPTGESHQVACWNVGQD